MKKLLLFAIIIPIAFLLAHDGVVVTQSSPHKISLSVSLPQLNIQTELTEARSFSQLYFDGADISTEIGAPQLPVIRELVEIPFEAEVMLSVNILNSENINLTNPVKPLQPSIPKSGPAPEFTMNQEAYSVNDYLFKERARIEIIGEIRGHRIAVVEIYPVAYNPSQNRVEYASEMTIDLHLAGANIGKTIQMRNDFYSRPYYSMLADLVKNFDAYALTPPPDLPIGYLMIVPDEWVSNIAPLVEWRTRKGYHVFVRTLSQIGGGTNTVVLNAIANAYNTWPIRPTFVLLVGDIDKIGFFTGSGTGSPPTDLNYSCLAGTDYWPDLDLSRASIANAAQLDSLVWKTIKYEKNEWLAGNEWTKKAYFIASNDGSFYHVAQNTHRYCMGVARRHGVICDSLFLYSNSGTPVTTAINGGRAWVTYSGHGSITSWADNSFTTTNVRQLTNVDKVPLVGTYACVSGNYASTSTQECFSEAWIRVGFRGAIAHYASSVNSYWTEDDTLERRVFDYAFDSSYFWAMGMLNKAKIRYFAQMGNTGMTRRYFEMYNMMGDGAIDVYSDIPAVLNVSYPSVIPLGMYNIPVTVTKSGIPVRNALVCAMVKSDTSRRAMAYTDISGQVSLPLTTLSPDSVYITVTGHNLAPHLGGTMALATSGAYVMHISHQIFDPAPGGNNNGIVNPGEAVEMRAWFKNFGSSTANNVRVWLRTVDNNIVITDSFKNLGNIGANDSAYTSDGFNFSVAANCTNNYRLQFSLTIKDAHDSTWVSNITINVRQCILEYVSVLVDDAMGNNNGIINRGETVNLIATIRNIGGDDAVNITSVLSSPTSGIQIIDASGNFPTIAPTNTGSNTADPYTIFADSSIVPGAMADFKIVVSSGLYVETLYFSLPIEIYICNFEANNGNYEPLPATGGWAWGVPTSGPNNAYSGTKVWATVLGGNYAASANWTLTSPVFTATGNNPTLKFYQWYDI
ncbi:MAG: hypothetical protein KGZ86_04105, partial [Candidatus Latescibacteria bacterium]|nr:hypothetical protein [Candidatus Latescibacterota bacterium]